MLPVAAVTMSPLVLSCRWTCCRLTLRSPMCSWPGWRPLRRRCHSRAPSPRTAPQPQVHVLAAFRMFPGHCVVMLSRKHHKHRLHIRGHAQVDMSVHAGCWHPREVLALITLKACGADGLLNELLVTPAPADDEVGTVQPVTSPKQPAGRTLTQVTSCTLAHTALPCKVRHPTLAHQPSLVSILYCT